MLIFFSSSFLFNPITQLKSKEMVAYFFLTRKRLETEVVWFSVLEHADVTDHEKQKLTAGGGRGEEGGGGGDSHATSCKA